MDLDNPAPGQGAELPCVYAVEFIADALVKQCAELDVKASKERRRSEQKAVEYYKSLATELDPMRKS
jgi:protein farnesyltransferase/geranylgeranyltransferase type-1 subunit alpha